SAGIRFILEKLFHTNKNFRFCLLSCLSFSFTDFLFKELISTVSTDGEKDINTNLANLSSTLLIFFIFFETFYLPFWEVAVSSRREKEYITHTHFVSSPIFSFF
ncbi:hypothetical protein, partial [Treponema berlinense]|uniref:hypothetical protein n=1 Tax=Treponema berlinense TaxID=225004 RepID=UPI003FD6D60D